MTDIANDIEVFRLKRLVKSVRTVGLYLWFDVPAVA